MLGMVSSVNALRVQFRLYVLLSVLQLQFYPMLPLFPSFVFDSTEPPHPFSLSCKGCNFRVSFAA